MNKEPSADNAGSPTTSKESGVNISESKVSSWRKRFGTFQIVLFSLGILFFAVVAYLAISRNDTATLTTLVMLALMLILIALLVRKWNWGWLVVYWFTFEGSRQAFTKYGAYNDFFPIFSLILGLAVYFTLRSRFQKKVLVKWKRSMYSGVIACAAATLLTAILGVIVPTQDQQVAKLIDAQDARMVSELTPFKERSEKLWSGFVAQPASDAEYQNNLQIVGASIPLFRRKDSIVVATMTLIHSGIKILYEQSKPESWALGYTPDNIQEIVDKAQDVSMYDSLMLSNLSLYYSSLLASDGNQGQYWKAYQESREKLAAASQDFITLSQKYGGYGVSKQLQAP